jgi:APA family basic amino acid/polyamine antiporter
MIDDAQELPQGFGFWSGAALVAASMIGTGILLTPGYTAAVLGSHLSGLFLWVVGGVLALCGALTLAEMASAIPKVGGEYVYVDRAFGPTTAFTYGWATLVVGFVGPTAAVALAAAKFLIAGLPESYAEAFSQADCPCGPALACAIVVVFMLVHCTGQRNSAWVQTATTGFKYGTLAAFALLGFAYAFRSGSWGNLADLATPSSAGTTIRPAGIGEHLSATLAMVAATVQSLVFVTFAYVGWNGAAYIAGEARDAVRIVPRALLAGCLAVTSLYVVMALAFAGTFSLGELRTMKTTSEKIDAEGNPTPDALKARETFDVLALEGVVRAVPTSVTKPVASALFGVGLIATVSAFLLTGSRVMVAMARAGHFLPLAGTWNARRNAPVAALLMLGIPTAAAVWYGKLIGLLELLGAGLNALGIVFAASIFVLRRRPDYRPAFRVPLYPLPPLVYLVACVGILGVSLATRFEPTAISLGVILLGAPIYWLARRNWSGR